MKNLTVSTSFARRIWSLNTSSSSNEDFEVIEYTQRKPSPFLMNLSPHKPLIKKQKGFKKKEKRKGREREEKEVEKGERKKKEETEEEKEERLTDILPAQRYQ